jgi:hypothetical protein
LLRTRSSTYDALVELPTEPRALELRVRPEVKLPSEPRALELRGRPEEPAYGVALSRIQPDGSVTQIGNVGELKIEPDGFVRLYVDSSRLEAGPYLLVITPAEDRTAASTTAFRIKVVAR